MLIKYPHVLICICAGEGSRHFSAIYYTCICVPNHTHSIHTNQTTTNTIHAKQFMKVLHLHSNVHLYNIIINYFVPYCWLNMIGTSGHLYMNYVYNIILNIGMQSELHTYIRTYVCTYRVGNQKLHL